ncbi:trypsin-like serine peptidase [Microtetraspora malaysiensis]|uniref:trypsin-like serine peptidase n=1 Tax=Microtetraspora malaysiensis TaxID=161358 RepID=UPI003D9418B6
MKRTLAFGGLVATAGLLAAGLAAPAQATNTVSSDNLANTNMAAKQVAAFWFGEAKANLLNATPYGVETKIVAKHVSKGGPSADSKPGIVPAIGDEKKAAAKSKNVNLPKTSGKVFFIGADHKPHWCSATSVQSSYKNLVATAGHCVYDTGANAATMDKWVFIPGYYQGKMPWGIYVGKQAFTHYDYDVYEDGDRDYAFVTVYDGVLPESATANKEYKSDVFATKAEAEAAKAKLQADKSTVWSRLDIVEIKGDDQAKPATVAEFQALNEGKDLTGDGPFADGTIAGKPQEIDAREYRSDKDSYVSRDGKTLYFRTKVDGKGGHGHGRHHDQKPEFKYFKRTFSTKAATGYQVVGKTFQIGLKSVGRLGDNVGGQGLAYNQKLGKPVFVFGYPSGTHPDGNNAFTGKTLKWSYGKTFAVQAPAIKGEELQGIKSPFTGEGAIGSSWLLNYNNGRRVGYLNGVTIGVSDTTGNNRYDTSFSPYFDGETYGVYKAAAAVWSGKIA